MVELFVRRSSVFFGCAHSSLTQAEKNIMALAAATRSSARSAAKKAARSLSSGADVLAGSGYVYVIEEKRGAETEECHGWHLDIESIGSF